MNTTLALFHRLTVPFLQRIRQRNYVLALVVLEKLESCTSANIRKLEFAWEDAHENLVL